MLSTRIHCRSIIPQTLRYFASPAGDGVSDPKNPRVFFEVGKDGKSIGKLTFEVNKRRSY